MYIYIYAHIGTYSNPPSHMSGYIGLENFCSIVESLAPWTDKTPVEKRATRADYEDALAEAGGGASVGSSASRYGFRENMGTRPL